MNSLIRVVVAIIQNKANKILITQRMADRIQPNLWEFPGGKITLYETGLQALKREVFEEVDIKIDKAMPFMQIYHDYKDYTVWLDIWQVEKYQGTPSGKEGQNIAWISLEQLSPYNFLEANKFIFKALKLPNFFLKLKNFYKIDDYLNSLREAKTNGFELVEISASNLSPKDYKNLLKQSFNLAKTLNLKIALAGDTDIIAKFTSTYAYSLNAKDINKQSISKLAPEKLICVWCENLDEVKIAEKLNADFIILSPILDGARALGWNGFQQITKATNLPVYAAGGIDESMFARIRALGGIGCLLQK